MTNNVQGEVKIWFTAKGFGFVKTELYGDVFFGKDIVKNEQKIEKGQKVRMEVLPSIVKRGEYQATKIYFTENDQIENKQIENKQIENDQYELATVEWFTGVFGVAKFQHKEYFIHKNEIKYGNLYDGNLILFIPTIRNNKPSASKIISIKS